jgi:ABC-2 type transport system permease protein
MLAIYKKELRSYFTSMMGYVFIAFFMVIIGIGFFIQNMANAYSNFEYALSSVAFIIVLLIPVLTMRLMAEENKQKTDQLLLTSPLSASSIVIGKLLAVFTIYLISMLITCIYPLILGKLGTVNYATAYAGILGFTMLGAAYLSIGLYISSLTESQVVAAVISFVAFLFTVLMDSIASSIPSSSNAAVIVFTIILLIICFVLYRLMQNLTVSVITGLAAEAALILVFILKPALLDGSVVKVCKSLSVISRYNQFYYGILDITGLIYYLSLTVLFAFLTTQVIRKKRWS